MDVNITVRKSIKLFSNPTFLPRGLLKLVTEQRFLSYVVVFNVIISKYSNKSANIGQVLTCGRLYELL